MPLDPRLQPLIDEMANDPGALLILAGVNDILVHLNLQRGFMRLTLDGKGPNLGVGARIEMRQQLRHLATSLRP